MMWKAYQRYRDRRRLTDPKYAYLFDEYEGDEFVSFDCETTGLDRKKDQIISIGAVKIRGRKILAGSKLHLFVRPDVNLSRDSVRVHHLREMDLEHGITKEEAALQFLDFIGNRPLVGYYLEFDIAMVNNVLRPLLGISLPNAQHEVSAIYYDKKIGRIPQGHVDLRFDSIRRDLQLPTLGQHSAINDAVMTALMFIKLQHTQSLTKENT